MLLLQLKHDLSFEANEIYMFHFKKNFNIHTKNANVFPKFRLFTLMLLHDYTALNFCNRKKREREREKIAFHIYFEVILRVFILFLPENLHISLLACNKKT